MFTLIPPGPAATWHGSIAREALALIRPEV